MTRYYLFHYVVGDGENKYHTRMTFEVEDGKVPREAMEEYLKDFFGDTTRADSGLYWSDGDLRCVRSQGWTELNKEDFDVLRRHGI